MSQINSFHCLVSQINNGLISNRQTITVPHSKFVIKVLDILTKGGFILGYGIKQKKRIYPFSVSLIYVSLKYFQGNSVIKNLKSISRPGCRLYISKKDLWKKKESFYFFIISTSKGLISDKEAKILGLGGEVLLKVD